MQEFNARNVNYESSMKKSSRKQHKDETSKPNLSIDLEEGNNQTISRNRFFELQKAIVNVAECIRHFILAFPGKLAECCRHICCKCRSSKSNKTRQHRQNRDKTNCDVMYSECFDGMIECFGGMIECFGGMFGCCCHVMFGCCCG